MNNGEKWLILNTGEFDGSGNETGHYDERTEKKKKRVGIALLLLLLAGVSVCLAMTIFLSVQDYNYYMNGTKQTVQCTSNQKTVTYTAPDGNNYMVDIFWSFTDQSAIDIYYIGADYSHAIAMTNSMLWFIFYGVFGGLFLIIIIALKKMIWPKKHAIVR